MLIAAWWNPFAAIGEAILNFFIGVLLFLDAIVYSLINWVYQIILLLCQIDILDKTFEIDALINRIYVIIGVVVLFLLAYSLLKSMVNPDEALKGKKSPVTIIKDVIISIALIALVPTIFSFAMKFQTAILEENTIGKIILGTTSTIGKDENGEKIEEDSGEIIRQGGTAIASNVLHAFLHPNYSNCTEDENTVTGYDCSNIKIKHSAYGVSGEDTFDDFWDKTVNQGAIMSITDLSDNIVDGGVTYYYIISTVAGVFVLFVLLSYCFDIALRLVKLAVFQLIAPLPILSRIMPNEQGGKVFTNWLKATISTYVEVFIRLAILFFAVLLIKIVVQNFTSIFAPFVSGSDSWTVILFAQLFVIIGIILFIKQAPQILKDITGLDSGKYNVLGSAFKSAAMLGGGVTAAVRNWNTNNPDGSQRKFHERLRSAAGGFGSAAFRSTWHRDDVKGLKDVKQNARNSAEEAIKKRISRENAKRERDSYFESIGAPTMEERGVRGKISGALRYKAHTLGEAGREWASGSFEVQQQILNEVNEFMKNAKAVKSTTEGLVRDKKYLFKMGAAKDYGNGIHTNGNETLSEIESMITTLKNSGDVEQAKIAARLESDMNKRIKTIGVEMQALSTKNFADAQVRAAFNNGYMADGFDIYKEASPTLSTAKSQIDIVNQKVQKNSSLEAVVNFKNLRDENGNPLVFEKNISKLADELEKQSAILTQQITLEQERRKNAPKGGKDK